MIKEEKIKLKLNIGEVYFSTKINYRKIKITKINLNLILPLLMFFVE